MSLEGITQQLSKIYKSTAGFVKEEKKYFISAGFFITTRAMDVATTLMLPGISPEMEAIPMTKYFMQTYGTTQGLILHQALLSTLILSGAYYLNQKKYEKVSGNRILNGISAISLAVAASNFVHYL